MDNQNLTKIEYGPNRLYFLNCLFSPDKKIKIVNKNFFKTKISLTLNKKICLNYEKNINFYPFPCLQFDSTEK